MNKRGTVDLCPPADAVIRHLPRGLQRKLKGVAYLSEHFPREQIMCYIAFMLAKVTITGTRAGDLELPVLKTPDNVEEVWRMHLLNNLEYSAFCRSLGSPHVVPHCPEWANDTSQDGERGRRTEATMTVLFGNKFTVTDGVMKYNDARKRSATVEHGDDFRIFLEMLSGEMLVRNVSSDTTIADVKDTLSVEDRDPTNEDFPAFVFAGKHLQNCATLQDAGVTEDCTIRVFLR